MKITRAGVDIAKSVFQVHGVDCHDKPVWQVKLKRGQWLEALCDRLVPGAEVGMEACASAAAGSDTLSAFGCLLMSFLFFSCGSIHRCCTMRSGACPPRAA